MSSPFSRLPKEVNIQIFGYLIPPLSSPEDQLYTRVFGRASELATKDLILTCKQFKEIVYEIHSIKAIRTTGSKIEFTLNPKLDTLVLFGMRIPKPDRDMSWLKSKEGAEVEENALPVRRLMTHSLWPMLPMDWDPQGDLSRSHQSQRYDTSRIWNAMPFKTNLPLFNLFPLIEELIVSVAEMDRNWNISGFQMHGPDVVAPREHGETWGLNRVGLHHPPVAYYFKNRGVQADSGIQWELPISLFPINWGYLISSPVDIASRVDPRVPYLPRIDRPYIGLNGYSRGTRSLGGKWAGFRYHPETQKVEFTPLAWHEVEPIVHRLGYNYSGMDRALPRGLDPHFIARVQIVREGKEPRNEPHHSWVEVKEPEEGDEPWVRELATT
ncbi:hypothetical protein IL306_003973 [Fusarium sp. DS 682]|nr:hypothetical protein IL306_003973 [Fusarium sp. DS 682]